MKRFDMDPSEIYGIVDDVLDRVEREGRKEIPKKKKRVPRPSSLPNMRVKRSHIPDELKKVDAGNVVYVPEAELKAMSSILDIETNALNKLLIRQLMPTMLAYQTSTTITRAALKEGLDVEIDFDEGLMDCVQHVGYLTLMMHFIRRSKLPISVKKRFINTLSDRLANQAVEAMLEKNKTQHKKQFMEELQAVVYSRQKDKVERKSSAPQQDADKPKPAIRRPRR